MKLVLDLLRLRLEQHRVELTSVETQNFLVLQGKAQALEKLIKDLTRKEVEPEQ
jgi:hypothetical protein